MSEMTADCDALKEKICKLESDNAALKRTEKMLRDNIDAAERYGQSQRDEKMELLKILGDTAKHLRVSEDGTNQDVSLRIWAAVNDLRRGHNDYLLTVARVAQAVDADTTGTIHNVMDSILVQFSKLKEEIDVLKADNQAAIEGRDKELNEQSGELKMYGNRYKELDQAAKKALASVGLTVVPEPYTVQQTILDALEKLAEAAFNDTVDSKLKELEQVCYSAESRSGIMCREENPWARIKWVLDGMSSEICRWRCGNNVHETVRTRMRETASRLGLVLTKVAWRSELGEVSELLGMLEKKALEGQDIKAACLKLKELL